MASDRQASLRAGDRMLSRRWQRSDLCDRALPAVRRRGRRDGGPPSMYTSIGRGNLILFSLAWRPCDVSECNDAFDLLPSVNGRLLPMDKRPYIRRRMRRRHGRDSFTSFRWPASSRIVGRVRVYCGRGTARRFGMDMTLIIIAGGRMECKGNAVR